MKILVLGGTGWLSSHVARIALEHGHAVTCLVRGTEIPNGARLVRADRDDDRALADVAGEQWDAVIDVAREPGHVRRAVRDLKDHTGRYILVSTVSVYAGNDDPGADESAERLPALVADTMADMSEYGSAKVAAEEAVLDGFGPERSVIARAGLIGGPGDGTGRTTYWPWRFAHPATHGVVAVPDAPELITAVIDVRDLAAFLVQAAAKELSGTYNLLGEPLSLREHLALARRVATADDGEASDEPRAIPMTEEFLAAAGVNPWAGEKSMPLWIPDPQMAAMSDRSRRAAQDAGLTLRPLAATLRDGMWWRSNNGGGAGLTDEDERDLLTQWRAAHD